MHAHIRVSARKRVCSLVHFRARERAPAGAQTLPLPRQHVLGLPRVTSCGRREAHPGAAVVQLEQTRHVKGRHEEWGRQVVDINLQKMRQPNS